MAHTHARTHARTHKLLHPARLPLKLEITVEYFCADPIQIAEFIWSESSHLLEGTRGA